MMNQQSHKVSAFESPSTSPQILSSQEAAKIEFKDVNPVLSPGSAVKRSVEFRATPDSATNMLFTPTPRQFLNTTASSSHAATDQRTPALHGLARAQKLDIKGKRIDLSAQISPPSHDVSKDNEDDQRKISASLQIGDLRKKLKGLHLSKLSQERNKIKSSIEKAISQDNFKILSPIASPNQHSIPSFSPSTPIEQRVHASASLPPMPPMAQNIPTLPNSSNSTCGPQFLLHKSPENPLLISPAGTVNSMESSNQVLSFALSNTTINSTQHQHQLSRPDSKQSSNFFSARSKFAQESLSTVQESDHMLMSSQNAGIVGRAFYQSNSTFQPSESFGATLQHSRNEAQILHQGQSQIELYKSYPNCPTITEESEPNPEGSRGEHRKFCLSDGEDPASPKRFHFIASGARKNINFKRRELNNSGMTNRVESSKLEAKELNESDHGGNGSEDGSVNLISAPPPSRTHRRDISNQIQKSESDLSTPPVESQPFKRGRKYFLNRQSSADNIQASSGSKNPPSKLMVLKRNSITMKGDSRNRASSLKQQGSTASDINKKTLRDSQFEFTLSSQEEQEEQKVEDESNYTLSPFLIIDKSQFQETPLRQDISDRSSNLIEKARSPASSKKSNEKKESPPSLQDIKNRKLGRRDTIVTLGPEGHGFSSVSPGQSPSPAPLPLHDQIISAFNSEEQGSHFFTPAHTDPDCTGSPRLACFKKCDEETLIFGEEFNSTRNKESELVEQKKQLQSLFAPLKLLKESEEDKSQAADLLRASIEQPEDQNISATSLKRRTASKDYDAQNSNSQSPLFKALQTPSPLSKFPQLGGTSQPQSSKSGSYDIIEMLIKDEPEQARLREKEQNDSREEQKYMVKKVSSYDLSLSGLSGIASAAMKAGISAFSNQSEGFGPSQKSSPLIGNVLLSYEANEIREQEEEERLRMSILKDHLQLYSQNMPRKPQFQSSVLKLGMRCSSAPPELREGKNIFLRPSQDLNTKVIREMKKYIMFLKQELRKERKRSFLERGSQSTTHNLNLDKISNSKSEELLPNTPPPNKPISVYAQTTSKVTAKENHNNIVRASAFSEEQNNLSHAPLQLGGDYEEEFKMNTSSSSSILRACASTSRLLTASELQAFQTKTQQKSRNLSVQNKSKTSDSFETSSISPSHLMTHLEMLKCKVAEIKKERNTFYKILQNTKKELESTRKARELERQQDSHQRILLSKKLSELTTELQISMQAQQTLQEQIRHLSTRPPPAPIHSTGISDGEYKRVMELANALDVKCGSQEIKIMQLSQELNQRSMDAESARLDHCSLFKAHHELSQKYEVLQSEKEEMEQKMEQQLQELQSLKSALDIERRVRQINQDDKAVSQNQASQHRSETGSLSFSTSAKKTNSHGPQPRQVNKQKQHKRGNSIHNRDSQKSVKADALSSGSSLEDLHEKQTGRSKSPQVKRVLNMDDLQEEVKTEHQFSSNTSPKLQFSESPIRVVKSSKREKEEGKSKEEQDELKYHHRRNTLATQNLENLAQEVAFYLSKRGDSKGPADPVSGRSSMNRRESTEIFQLSSTQKKELQFFKSGSSEGSKMIGGTQLGSGLASLRVSETTIEKQTESKQNQQQTEPKNTNILAGKGLTLQPVTSYDQESKGGDSMEREELNTTKGSPHSRQIIRKLNFDSTPSNRIRMNNSSQLYIGSSRALKEDDSINEKSVESDSKEGGINPMVEVDASKEMNKQGKSADKSPIEMPRSLNSTMQYKSSIASLVDDEEKKEVEELLVAASQEPSKKESDREEKKDIFPDICAQINKAIEEDELAKKPRPSAAAAAVIPIQEYKELSDKYHKAEYERGQLVKVLQMLGISSHQNNEELSRLLELKQQANSLQKLKVEFTKKYDSFKKALLKQSKRWEMVSAREDKLERREQKMSDREINILKREELLNCKQERINELEKLVEYKNARSELQQDILKQQEAARKRKKKQRRAQSLQRNLKMQQYYQTQLFTMPDYYEPHQENQMRLASEEAVFPNMLSQPDQYLDNEKLQSSSSMSHYLAKPQIVIEPEARGIVKKKNKSRKPNAQAQLVRAQTTKSLLQVNSKQLENKFKNSLFSPEDYRSQQFLSDNRRPASSATAHFTQIVPLSSRRDSMKVSQFQADRAFSKDVNGTGYQSSVSSMPNSPFALFQQKFGGRRSEMSNPYQGKSNLTSMENTTILNRKSESGGPNSNRDSTFNQLHPMEIQTPNSVSSRRMHPGINSPQGFSTISPIAQPSQQLSQTQEISSSDIYNVFNERRASGVTLPSHNADTDFKRPRDKKRHHLLLNSQLEDEENSPGMKTFDNYLNPRGGNVTSFKRHQQATRSSIQVPKSRGSSNPSSFLFKQNQNTRKSTARQSMSGLGMSLTTMVGNNESQNYGETRDYELNEEEEEEEEEPDVSEELKMDLVQRHHPSRNYYESMGDPQHFRSDGLLVEELFEDRNKFFETLEGDDGNIQGEDLASLS